MTDQYAVMGNPIKHSKSPFIHTEFAQQTGQDITYDAILVEKDGFKQAVRDFYSAGGKGLNITVPFKEEAWNLVDDKSQMAEKAGAVNTISISDAGHLIGNNTDGIGIVRDLKQNHAISLQNKRLLILGAGGAVRGVLGPILAEKPVELVIANRTVSKAEALLEIFNASQNIKAVGFDGVAGAFDIIINGTAASLSGEMPAISGECARGAVCYDMMYAKDDTIFMQWARQNEAVNVLDGLGMLVEQAAESFYIWRGVKPETQSVIEKVRSSF